MTKIYLHNIALPAFLVLCFILFLTACGDVNVQNSDLCNVTSHGNNMYVMCADGTNIKIKLNKNKCTVE